MSEQETPQESQQTAPEAAEDKAEMFPRSVVEELRREAAKYRTAAAEKEAKLQAIEDSQKTEVEKAIERAQQAEARANEATLRALRAEVAQAKGLTPAQAKRLSGSSLEELEADADELLETFGIGKPVTPGSQTPKPTTPRVLSGSDEPVEESDPAKLAEAVMRGAW